MFWVLKKNHLTLHLFSELRVHCGYSVHFSGTLINCSELWDFRSCDSYSDMATRLLRLQGGCVCVCACALFVNHFAESTRLKESFKQKRFLINSLLLTRMPACFDGGWVFFSPWRIDDQTLNSKDVRNSKVNPPFPPIESRRVGRDLIWFDLIWSDLIWVDLIVSLWGFVNDLFLLSVWCECGCWERKLQAAVWTSCVKKKKWAWMIWTSGYIWIDWWRERIKVALWQQYKYRAVVPGINWCNPSSGVTVRANQHHPSVLMSFLSFCPSVLVFLFCFFKPFWFISLMHSLQNKDTIHDDA